MLDTEQRHQIGVTARLRDDACAGIHQDDGEISRRTAGNHVARILFVSRRVGNDEFAVVRAEVTIRHVDGNTLFAFRLQAVQQQGIVDVVTCIADAFAVTFQCIQLVLVNLLTIEQQPSDKRRFPVVHRTGGQETKQVFLFVFI